MTQCCTPFRDPNTIRILEIDGGGEKNYMSMLFLNRFIQQWGIDAATIAEQFDVICGSGFGGLIALLLAYGVHPDTIEAFFVNTTPNVYSTSGTPSSKLPLAGKIDAIEAGTYFYDSGLDTTFGSGKLREFIEGQFGFNTLQALKTNVVIPTYEQLNGKYILCSNLDYPEFDGQKETITNVALATSSNNPYLPPMITSSTIPGKLNGTYNGGEIYLNNPSALGRAVGEILKNKRRCCLLSLGTGYGGTTGFFGADGLTPGSSDAAIANVYKQYSLSYAGGAESVDRALFLEAEYGDSVGNQLYYYRFNPLLVPVFNTEEDNTSDDSIMTYYDSVVANYFNTDIQNISTFLRHLIA